MSGRPGLPHLQDALLAVPVGVLVLGTLRFAGRRGRWGPADAGVGPSAWTDGSAPDVWAYLLAAVAVLAVALRRWPMTAFVLAVCATTTYLALGYPFGPILVAVLVTAFSLARRVPLPRTAFLAGGGIALLLAHVSVTASPLAALVATLPVTAWVVVPFCVGLARRLVVEARERQRAEQERTALDAERLRLASEVHDVVGHGLAAIQMQADIALHVAERRPEQAQKALTVISRASAEALTELRATLAAIAPESTEAESRAPTPGLDRIEQLCARMREAGIDVELETTGQQRAVAPATGVATYRIVQEALTNVVKHAAERRARVQVAYREAAVELTVSNAAAAIPELREGFGITGIRRRTADVGGAVEIAAADGMFSVHAVLPG